LVYYALPERSSGGVPMARIGQRLGDAVVLDGFAPGSHLDGIPGEPLRVSLYWRAEEPVDQDLVVFVQLLDMSGKLWAQVDRQPVAGFRPTSSWQPGEVIRDNYGLLLPAEMPPGDYELIAGLYLPTTMERLAVSTSQGVLLGDHVSVTSISLRDH
jgi:hypothetical protein